MSPIPYVRGQVMFLALLVALAEILAAGPIPAGCACAALVWMLVLRRKYHRDVARADAAIPDHRAKLDRVVSGDALLALPAALLICAGSIALSIDPAPWLVVVGKSITAFAVGWTVVYGSSLVDWYLILPRISGQLGHRPCRAAVDQEQFAFPSTWREVTRWWYIHRVVATLAFRFGLSAALAVALGSITGLDVVGRAGAWIVMLTFGAYALTTIVRGSTLAKQVGQAGHVKGIVGQTVKVERRQSRRDPLLFWRKLPPLVIEGTHYVVDVALESIQLADVAQRDRPALPIPISFERNFDTVPLSDVDAIRQGHPKFSGCTQRCSGINWYCIENPRCFNPK
jgi:hypothetical protein